MICNHFVYENFGPSPFLSLRLASLVAVQLPAASARIEQAVAIEEVTPTKLATSDRESDQRDPQPPAAVVSRQPLLAPPAIGQRRQ